MLFEMLGQAGIIAILSMAVVTAPMILGIVYAIRPSEARLTLMRPLSLAAIFAALCGTLAGVVNVLAGIGRSSSGAVAIPSVAVLGLSEAIVPLFVGFGCLTVAWLAVALGLRRQSA